MVSYTEVQTELNTNWNVGVIAKPTFRNGALNYSVRYPNFLFIKIGTAPEIKSISLNNTLEMRVWNWTIRIVANNRSDLDKFIKETRRIILAKSITSGWWRIVGQPTFTALQKRYVATLICQEKRVLGVSDW